MHIVVAIRARAADIPEGPVLPILHVASETWSGLVRTFKRERRLLMLLDAEHAHLESISKEVAFHAIGGRSVLGEYPFVVVLVATIAGIEHDRIGVGTLVALLAIHAHVPALQREVREVMVELVHGAQGREALLLVALGTVGPELPFVRVLVAGGALVLLNAVPVLEDHQGIAGLLVAFETIGRPVLAEQPEVRSAMVETVLAREHVEGLLRVALCACVGEVGPVRIIMARLAIGVGYIGEFLELLAVTRGHLVAFQAVDLHVTATQGEFGSRMVELLRRLERVHVMAIQAGRGHRSLMAVLMTA